MFVLRDGKIRTTACEVPVTHHCHLSCRSCSHLSPLARHSFASPETVHQDLSALARWYQADCVRLLGGEPLLHRQLIDVIAAVRHSGIAPRIRVVTNGVLLPRMGNEFWQGIDEVWVSEYPGYELAVDARDRCAVLAREHGVKLTINHYDRFREATTWIPHRDPGLVRKIYDTCQPAHLWSCQTIDKGFFYKCPQSLFIPALLHDQPWPDAQLDGLRIHDAPSFRDELLTFLNSTQTLASCSHCLGSAGKRFAHTQEERGIRPRQDIAPADLIDWDFLARLEIDPAARDSTISSTTVLAEPPARHVSLFDRLKRRIAG